MESVDDFIRRGGVVTQLKPAEKSSLVIGFDRINLREKDVLRVFDYLKNSQGRWLKAVSIAAATGLSTDIVKKSIEILRKTGNRIEKTVINDGFRGQRVSAYKLIEQK